MRDRSASASAHPLFPGADPTAAAHRDKDWSATPLGPVEGWSETLRDAVRTVVPSRIPMLLWWGPEQVQIYNEPYAALMGDKHPAGVGQAAAECWAEAWDDLAPLVAEARSGESTHSEDLPLLIRRHGFDEETSWTFSYSPVRGPDGEVEGLFVATTDTTQARVRGGRLGVLGRLGAYARSATPSIEAIVGGAVEILAECPGDVRFAVARIRSGLDGPLVPVATLGLADDAEVDGTDAPGDTDLLAAVLADREPRLEEAPADGWPARPAPPDREPTRRVLHLPIVDAGLDRAIGTLSVGINPHRAYDQDYVTFLELVARHISTAATDAAALASEQRRAEALADIDRAKTRFLQNVSHELRTPLSLLTTSHRALLADPDLAGPHRDDVEAAERATQRLRLLVDGLLDIARAEDGQLEPQLVPTDPAELTADVVSMFRSAAEAAGLAFDVRIEVPPTPVELDPEMWSRIVSNLVGNAYKFTDSGGITVGLTCADGTLSLAVGDTGVGIPVDEVPRLFDRFHQVPGTSSRTAEGAGIGLALVRDLAGALGGTVQAESTVGVGSRFTVRIPHRPTEAVPESPGEVALEPVRTQVAEAEGWMATPTADDDPNPAEDRILVVEDNADMRAHVVRLLRADGWAVDAVGDVASALARPGVPVLIVSDIMLPGLDGIDLLHALRADPERVDVPVVLLTARAGPEAAAEGLAAGATDHLTKPFDPAELVARVRSHAELHRRRRDAFADADSRAEHLELALRSNRRIGAAIGIIMERERVTEDEAFARLRKASQDGNRKLRDLAEQIVLTGAVPAT